MAGPAAWAGAVLRRASEVMCRREWKGRASEPTVAWQSARESVGVRLRLARLGRLALCPTQPGNGGRGVGLLVRIACLQPTWSFDYVLFRRQYREA